MEDTNTLFDTYSMRFRSEKTIKDYRAEIGFFEEYTGKPFCEADRDDVDDYVAFLDGSGLKSTTLSKKLHVLSAFGEYLYHEKIISTNPFKYSYGSAVTYRPIDTKDLLPKEITDQLIETLKSNGEYAVALVCQMILGTGCTVSEVLRLQAPLDVTYSEKQHRFAVTFHNYPPYQLARTVPLPDSISDDLLAYLNQLKAPRGPLFIGRSGRPLSRWTVEHALAKIGDITCRDLKASAKISYYLKAASDADVLAASGGIGRWNYRYRKAAEDIQENYLDR